MTFIYFTGIETKSKSQIRNWISPIYLYLLFCHNLKYKPLTIQRVYSLVFIAQASNYPINAFTWHHNFKITITSRKKIVKRLKEQEIYFQWINHLSWTNLSDDSSVKNKDLSFFLAFTLVLPHKHGRNQGESTKDCR